MCRICELANQYEWPLEGPDLDLVMGEIDQAMAIDPSAVDHLSNLLDKLLDFELPELDEDLAEAWERNHR